MASNASVTAVIPSSARSDVRETFEQYVNRVSLRIATPAGIIVGLMVIILNSDRNPVPFAEDLRSFAMIAVLAMFPIAAISAGAGFVLGIRAWNARVDEGRQRKWGWALAPVSLAYAGLAGGVLVALLLLTEFAFRDLQLNTYQAALLVGAGTSGLIIWIVGETMRVDTTRLLKLIIIILASGIYLTAVGIDDAQWWRVSFSYLGKLESNVNYVFNATLIFCGLLILVWNTYLMSDYRVLLRHGIAEQRWAPWVRLALIWLGIAVMFVGTFKSKATPFSTVMHDFGAYTLALTLILLMATSRWTVPGFPREFRVLSLVLVAIVVVAHLWAAFGAVNIVGLEIVDFALGIFWLAQFARSTENMAAKLEPEAFPA